MSKKTPSLEVSSQSKIECHLVAETQLKFLDPSILLLHSLSDCLVEMDLNITVITIVVVVSVIIVITIAIVIGVII